MIVLLPILRRRGLMDVPNARSSHTSPVPRGGGLAVLIGLLGSAAAFAVAGGEVLWPVLAAALLVAALGFADDVWSLDSRVRLVVQLAVASALAVWIHNAFGFAEPALLCGVLGAVGVVAYVNAFNFMDGINGISAMNACVAGGWFAWVGFDYELDGVPAIALGLTGASLGFLPWNSPVARVFLGDVGSYALGMVLAGLAAVCWAQGVPGLLCVAPLALYLADTGWALAERARRGRRLLDAHRDHAYQRLVDGGWSQFQTATLTAVVAALMAVLAWFLEPAVLGAAAVLALAVGYLLLPTLWASSLDHRRLPS